MTGDSVPTTTVVWRVTWHRTSWSSCANSRTFARRHDAARFLDKLQASDRPDLSPLDRLEVHRRPVGAWESVELSHLGKSGLGGAR